MAQNAIDNEFDEDLITDYREGFDDHYEIIINCIATLEATPNNADCIDELFRAFHTVKGNARMLMFAELADFLHSVEESVSALREQKITFTELLGESITLSLDKAREISETIFAHSIEDDPSIEVIRNIFQELSTCKQQELDSLCANIIKEITGFDIETTSLNAASTIPEANSSTATSDSQFCTEMVQEMHLYIGEATPEHLKDHLGYMRYLALMLEAKIPHWQGRIFSSHNLLNKFNDALDKPITSHQLEMTVYTHDLAFAFLPNNLMLKKEKFTDSEFSIMHTHTQIAADLIGLHTDWKEAHDIVLQHHERSDGNGYPNKLNEDKICIGAKMLNIVDAFVAMTTPRPDRPYKRSVLTALNELKAQSGKQFSKELVPVFINLLVNELK